MEVTENYVIVDWKSIMATAEKWKKKQLLNCRDNIGFSRSKYLL
jgi:hypothetical protein